MTARFHELARVELEDAAEYYEKKASGLGLAFVAEVRAAVAFVERHPHGGPPLLVDGETTPFRKRVVRRFPYVILYAVDGDDVEIKAVTSTHRKPRSYGDR